MPASVSLVEESCEAASTSLRVLYQPLTEQRRKDQFGVCSKGLDFPTEDISLKLGRGREGSNE